MSKWISADVRHPKLHQRVLVIHEDIVKTADYNGSGIFIGDNYEAYSNEHEVIYKNVKYWMPLPALPKD